MDSWASTGEEREWPATEQRDTGADHGPAFGARPVGVGTACVAGAQVLWLWSSDGLAS